MYDRRDNAEDSGRTYLIAEMPDHERPRERLLENGVGALSDTELLAILLRTGSVGRSAVDLARDLLALFHGDLIALTQATVQELCTIRGIGLAKAVEIHAAFALALRVHRQHGRRQPRISGPEDVASLLRAKLRGKRQEEFHVLLLDTKNAVLRDECATVGLVDRSQVHAREVFRSAIRECCSRVVLAHNHPSGDPTPSTHDISCTRNLVSAGKIVGIEILDHVVIGRAGPSRPRDYVSFSEEGLL